MTSSPTFSRVAPSHHETRVAGHPLRDFFEYLAIRLLSPFARVIVAAFSGSIAMAIVIGSGPAGVACAKALLDRGVDVTMLDAGLQLEADKQAARSVLSRQPHNDWDTDALGRIRGRITTDHSQMPAKFGSDFAWRAFEDHFPSTQEKVQLRGSLARGGFSNVWGATMLPFTNDDIAAWPISVEDLEPHYRALFSFVPLVATADGLGNSLPLYTDHHETLKPSRQAEAMLENLAQHQDALARAGITFGRARLAVRSGAKGDSPGCVYCGLCLRGCPYDLIYNSAVTVEQLTRNHDQFAYQPDVLVRKLVERGNQVDIQAVRPSTGDAVSLSAERVYVACGIRASTHIVLESLEAFGEPVTIRDCGHFTLPMLRYSRMPGVANEQLHTLSQIFLEILDASIAPNMIHLQLYTYNDVFPEALRDRAGVLCDLFSAPSRWFLERLVVAFGYLHSDSSTTIRATLNRPSGDSHSILALETSGDESLMRRVMKRTVRKLSRHRGKLRALPLGPFMRVGTPGQFFHSGGSLPMRDEPNRLETDVLGRPQGLSRVHVVDASVFPSVPATSITMSVMANAHRIGSHAFEI